MKKVLALIIAAMMIVSMIPVMAITTAAADVEGNWTTYRSAAGYDEPEEGEEESYTPAPGYEYNNEGLHLTSPSYAGCTPFGTVQSKEAIDIKDGVYMEIRVDNFSYGGREEGAANNGFGTADNWISFSIWDSEKIAPGSLDYGQGWLSLVRHRAAIEVESFVSTTTAFGHQGNTAITPEVDAEGREIYTFEISNDGTNYTISICGVPVAGSAAITSHLNSLNADGEFYIGVSFHSGVADGVLEATMLKFGTSKEDAETPIGSDSEKPEDNINVTAEIADPSTIEENQPCLIFDATESSHSGKIGTSGMELEAQGDNSYKVLPNVAVGFHTWSIKRSLSFDAKDFPVIGIFVHDPNQVFESGVLRYSAGKNMSADDVHILNYSIYDDGCRYWGDDDEYTFIVIDMKELLDEAAFEEGWNGRINSLRFDYSGLYLSTPDVDPETDYFFFHYAGIFRSVEEANAYQDVYAEKIGLGEASTEEPTEEPTEAPSEEPTEPGEGTNEEATNDSEGKDTGASGDEGTKAPESNETETEAKKGGCGSVIGSVAVLLSAAAAAVVLKKRD